MTKKRIYEEIGWFYFEKNKYNIKKTNEEIQSLCITDVSLKDNELKIETARPGLLIGFHGENFEKLSNYLKEKLERKFHLLIIENQEISYLYNYQYTQSFFD